MDILRLFLLIVWWKGEASSFKILFSISNNKVRLGRKIAEKGSGSLGMMHKNCIGVSSEGLPDEEEVYKWSLQAFTSCYSIKGMLSLQRRSSGSSRHTCLMSCRRLGLSLQIRLKHNILRCPGSGPPKSRNVTACRVCGVWCVVCTCVRVYVCSIGWCSTTVLVPLLYSL